MSAVYAVIWASAICINQTDDEEKTSQVQQMWNIYHQATYVAAWLGMCADNSDVLFDLIAQLGRQLPETALRWSRLERIKVSESDFAGLDFYPSPSDLKALVRRTYWQRVWIQQEIRASSEIWIHCGRKRVRAEWLRFVVQLFMAMKSSLFLDMVTDENNIESETLGASLLDIDIGSFEAAFLTLNALRNRAPLITLMKQAFGISNVLKCSDPRDRVFAFLGFASDALDLGICPHYSKTCLQVYTETAMALIKKDMSIMTMHNKSSDDRLAGLPSWAPDWTQPFQWPLVTLTREDIRYRAAGSTNSNLDFLYLQDGCIALSATGCVFDLVVQHEPEELLDESRGTHALIHTLQRIGDVTSLAQTSVFYRDFESVCEELPTLFPDSSETETRSVALRHAVATIKQCLQHRRLFISMRGRVGLGPPGLAQGDVLAILLGLDVPLILRKLDGNKYRIIGNAYCGGIMDGEIFKHRNKIQRLHIL
ncbi:hypothetical protein BT63DRAFT_483126 [Microthyrium microscopicum]|uniref:Heterokaryon incompatibility domain-containing protein n=1 Tax=Microthyrium microscopicum TaxID=703497 RepID=A0A6A6TZJ4_9PEZI|nr:hypothetical protein BT63DRAFT_483126 [Microthyrium microscopicum]